MLNDDFKPARHDSEFAYCRFNPNPRNKVTSDCVKRAIVVASGIAYKELELDMNRNKRIKTEPYNDKRNYEPYITQTLGGKGIGCNVPIGRKRWTTQSIAKVLQRYKSRNFILRVSHHLIGIRQGVLYDLNDIRSSEKAVYKIYVFGATEKELTEIKTILQQGDTRRFIL